MLKKSSGRSQSSSSGIDDMKDVPVIGIGEAMKKKRTSDSDHSEGDQKHKKRKIEDDIKKKGSHSDDRDKSHKTKKGKKKSRHHRKTPTKTDKSADSSFSKSKDSTSSSHDKSKKHSPESKHSLKDSSKDSSKSKSRSDADKGSKLAKIRAKFQGRQTFNSRSSTFSPTTSLSFKRDDLDVPPNNIRNSEPIAQKTANVRKVKRKRRIFLPMKNVKLSKFIRFKLLRRRRRKPCEFIREVSPSLSKPQAVDPDLIEDIATGLDPELKLESDVKVYLADDITIRLRYIIENANELVKHSGRRTLTGCDIDSVLTEAEFGRIYGPLHTFYCTENGKYYFDNPDMGVHLGTEAIKTLELKQAGIPYLKQQWYQTEEMTAVTNDYFSSICKCVFSHNERLATLAFQNLKRTRKLNSQLIDQLASVCFDMYSTEPALREVILVLIRILAMNPSADLIQPSSGIKLLATLLVTELFPKPTQTEETTISNNALQFEVTETLCTLIQYWKVLEVEILSQIEKCLNNRSSITIPEGVLRIVCTHGIEITKLLFWDRLTFTAGHNTENSIYSQVNYEQDDEKLWVMELRHNKVETSEKPVEVMEVDYELKHRLLFASRFVYSSLFFTSEWSKEISILLGDSLVPFFPQKALCDPMISFISQHTIYKGVQTKRISLKIETTTHSVYDHFENYKYLMPRVVILNYGLPQLVNNRKSLYLTRELRGRLGTQVRGTKIINVDIRKSNTFSKERKVQKCISHSLFMSL